MTTKIATNIVTINFPEDSLSEDAPSDTASSSSAQPDDWVTVEPDDTNVGSAASRPQAALPKGMDPAPPGPVRAGSLQYATYTNVISEVPVFSVRSATVVLGAAPDAGAASAGTATKNAGGAGAGAGAAGDGAAAGSGGTGTPSSGSSGGGAAASGTGGSTGGSTAATKSGSDSASSAWSAGRQGAGGVLPTNIQVVPGQPPLALPESGVWTADPIAETVGLSSGGAAPAAAASPHSHLPVVVASSMTFLTHPPAWVLGSMGQIVTALKATLGLSPYEELRVTRVQGLAEVAGADTALLRRKLVTTGSTTASATASTTAWTATKIDFLIGLRSLHRLDMMEGNVQRMAAGDYPLVYVLLQQLDQNLIAAGRGMTTLQNADVGFAAPTVSIAASLADESDAASRSSGSGAPAAEAAAGAGGSDGSSMLASSSSSGVPAVADMDGADGVKSAAKQDLDVTLLIAIGVASLFGLAILGLAIFYLGRLSSPKDSSTTSSKDSSGSGYRKKTGPEPPAGGSSEANGNNAASSFKFDVELPEPPVLDDRPVNVRIKTGVGKELRAMKSAEDLANADAAETWFDSSDEETSAKSKRKKAKRKFKKSLRQISTGFHERFGASMRQVSGDGTAGAPDTEVRFHEDVDGGGKTSGRKKGGLKNSLRQISASLSRGRSGNGGGGAPGSEGTMVRGVSHTSADTLSSPRTGGGLGGFLKSNNPNRLRQISAASHGGPVDLDAAERMVRQTSATSGKSTESDLY